MNNKVEQGREGGALEIDIEVKLNQLSKDIARSINKLSLESFFADTPDFILADFAVLALQNFALTTTVYKDWKSYTPPIPKGKIESKSCLNCSTIEMDKDTEPCKHCWKTKDLCCWTPKADKVEGER